MYCSNCGVVISSTTEICPKCGVRPFRTKAYCYSCGEKNLSKYQVQCKTCGTDLDAKVVSASIDVDMNASWFSALQLPPGIKQLMVKFKRE
ncbi:hypothetical protein HHO41_17535 [Bacillus sp. DNRA2]|uniref:hypothetical protein n=1 Tax=Bacillus sp. DNRA2 TaxID=2723053 RepID=UPI00145E1904|nr:hypothetical protein [Bacillus sp. DNRA2]NMD72100.1 hypothetical protein [Bacillus sp. DNRA2]